MIYIAVSIAVGSYDAPTGRSKGVLCYEGISGASSSDGAQFPVCPRR